MALLCADYMGKFFLLTAFFITVPFVLLSSLLFYSYVSFQKNQTHLFSQNPTTRRAISYAAIPTAGNLFSQTIEEGDSRVEKIRQFLAFYKSPLEPFAKTIVHQADTYNLDYRLLPAIAMQESNLCKKIPKDSFNCWGFGIYGKKVTRFADYSQAIETVSKTLAHQYRNKGLETPAEIQKKYNPSNTSGWENAVSLFMDKLQINSEPTP